MPETHFKSVPRHWPSGSDPSLAQCSSALRSVGPRVGTAPCQPQPPFRNTSDSEAAYIHERLQLIASSSLASLAPWEVLAWARGPSEQEAKTQSHSSGTGLKLKFSITTCPVLSKGWEPFKSDYLSPNPTHPCWQKHRLCPPWRPFIFFFFFPFLFFSTLLRALCMLGIHLTTELHPQPTCHLFYGTILTQLPLLMMCYWGAPLALWGTHCVPCFASAPLGCII